MKVKLAAQTFSLFVADALEFLQAINIKEFSDCTETIKFIRVIDHLFDFLNSRNLFFFVLNIIYFEQFHIGF